MVGCLESLTVIISASFAKKRGLQSKQLITVKSENLWYPALIHINKKSKLERILSDNGCIPDMLNRKKFSMGPGCQWLFAKAVSFSFFKRINDENPLLPESEVLDDSDSANISLSELASVCDLCHFLKKQLIKNGSICLKVGMKISLKYLTQTFILTVENISPSFYENSDTLFCKVSFRCFEGTQIEIIEDEDLRRIPDSVGFESFGGYENELKDLKENIDKLFAGKRSVSGILISGMSGVGKSFIGKILNCVYRDKCKVLGSEDIISSYKGEAEATLKLVFERAHARAPSIIFIDDIDEICVSRDHATQNVGIVNAVLHLMDVVQNTQSKEVLVIATASRPKTLDQALRRPGRLSHDIFLTVPNEKDRLSIFQCLLKEIPPSYITNDFLSLIASKTSGFVAADLTNLITEAFSQTEEEFPSVGHFLKALAGVKPSSLKNVATQSNKVSLEEICGFQNLKTSLLTVFQMSLHHHKLFSANGIISHSRILLFGPSGCGKSTIIYGLANHFSLVIIPVKRSSVFGKYFGESEKNLGLLFEQAQKSSPCILHFENFDGIAGRKHRDAAISTDVEGRVINHLKVMMDGVIGYENIFVLAETNRPDLLDKDVIRHGRFHKYFFFDLPSCEDRKLIIEEAFRSSHFGLNFDMNDSIDDLVVRTKGFSVAEINLLCKEIKLSLEEQVSADDLSTITGQLLSTAAIEAFETVSPGTSSKMMRKYQEFSSVYCQKF